MPRKPISLPSVRILKATFVLTDRGAVDKQNWPHEQEARTVCGQPLSQWRVSHCLCRRKAALRPSRDLENGARLKIQSILTTSMAI